MKYADLFALTVKAQELKPKFREPCNHCGWCCMTEVCHMGEFNGASPSLPCEYLTENNMCQLVLDGVVAPFELAIGKGCDAITQDEQLQEIITNGKPIEIET